MKCITHETPLHSCAHGPVCVTLFQKRHDYYQDVRCTTLFSGKLTNQNDVHVVHEATSNITQLILNLRVSIKQRIKPLKTRLFFGSYGFGPLPPCCAMGPAQLRLTLLFWSVAAETLHSWNDDHREAWHQGQSLWKTLLGWWSVCFSLLVFFCCFFWVPRITGVLRKMRIGRSRSLLLSCDIGLFQPPPTTWRPPRTGAGRIQASARSPAASAQKPPLWKCNSAAGRRPWWAPGNCFD